VFISGSIAPIAGNSPAGLFQGSQKSCHDDGLPTLSIP
jgi:hypothetical protein